MIRRQRVRLDAPRPEWYSKRAALASLVIQMCTERSWQSSSAEK